MNTNVRKTRKDRPETVRQAVTWENTKNKYMAAGLCGGCAGQAAYGHQLGFHRIKDPCPEDVGKTVPDKLIDRHGDRGARWLAGHFRDATEDTEQGE
jgi:hypothetical protein